MSHAVVKTDKDEFDVPIKKIIYTFMAAIRTIIHHIFLIELGCSD